MGDGQLMDTVMTEAQEIMPDSIDWQAKWQVDFRQAICPVCDASFLLPGVQLNAQLCPNCFRGTLEATENVVADKDHGREPERVLPFKVDDGQALTAMRRFTDKIAQPPQDLTPDNLKARLQRVFLPVWLVDADVEAAWGLDAGYEEPITQQEQVFKDGKWVASEVPKMRTRWKQRVGNLKRRYDNVHAPALESYHQLELRIGDYDEAAAIPYAPDSIADTMIMLPDRSTDDAWVEVPLSMRRLAEAEAKDALKAHHIRDYRWTPTFSNLNWTLLLVPLYTSYYLDDNGLPCVLFVNGSTGDADGVLRGSIKRARTQLIIGVVAAVVLFALGFFLGFIGLQQQQVVFVVLGALAFGAAIAALLYQSIPLTRVIQFNRVYSVRSLEMAKALLAESSQRFAWAKFYDPTASVNSSDATSNP